MHSVNKSCQPFSHTSTTSVATFICFLVYCNSLLPYLRAFILALLPSPHSNQSDPFTIEVRSYHNSSESRLSNVIPFLTEENQMVYKALHNLALLGHYSDSSCYSPCFFCCSHTDLLTVPQTNQAHLTPLSLRTCCFLWLKCFLLIHLYGCLPHFFQVSLKSP